jgi:chromosome segregation ATPase
MPLCDRWGVRVELPMHVALVQEERLRSAKQALSIRQMQEQQQHLEQTLDDSKAIVEQLRQQVRHVKILEQKCEQLETISLQRATRERELTARERELSSSNSRLQAHLRRFAAEKHAQLTAVTSTAVAEAEYAECLEKELASMPSVVEPLIARYRLAEEQLAIAETQRALERKALQQSQDAIAQLHAQIDTLEQKLEALRIEAGEVPKLQENVRRQQAELGTAMSERQSHLKSIEELNARCSSLQEQDARRVHEITTLHRSNDELHARFFVEQEHHASQFADLEAARLRLEQDLRKEHAVAEEQMVALHEARAQVVSSRQEAAENMDQVYRQKRHFQDQINALKDQLAAEAAADLERVEARARSAEVSESPGKTAPWCDAHT